MTFCGLDFGTSNSTIGVVWNNRHTMVPLEQNAKGQWQTTLPSALFLDFNTNNVHVGREALNQYTKGKQGRLIRSMKSILGSPNISDGTEYKRRFYSYDEIIGFFVSGLKEKAESFLETESARLESVVMGRPVYFSDEDPELDRQAEKDLEVIARNAGFKEVSFQYEPIAAALDYEEQIDSEELALIVDIGGGTSDFTIVRLSPERHHLGDRRDDFIAHHGVLIGGTDFDQQLSMAGVMPEFGLGSPFSYRQSVEMPSYYYRQLATWHRIHLLYEREIFFELKDLRVVAKDKEKLDRLLAVIKYRKGHQLAMLVELAKIDLSTKSEAEIDLENLLPEELPIAVSNCTTDRELLRGAIQGDIDRIFDALDETLRRANVAHRQIDTVFTTGGSTALPMIKSRVENMFPDAQHVEGDLYNSVGSGLLMEADRRYS